MESIIAALSAARLGSFSAAALELETTHAAVSRRIASAEEWAGVRLFDRHGRGVLPTSNGQRILARLAVAIDQITTLGRQSKRGAKRAAPTIKIAMTPAFARFWLFPRLRDLEGEHEDVCVEVVADLRHADFVRGEADLAVRYGRGGWKAGKEVRLFEEPLIPVATKELVTRLRPSKASEMAAVPLLHGGDSTNWRFWSATFGAAFTPKSTDRTFSDYSLALDAARAGLGVALWNRGLHELDGTLMAFKELEVIGELGYFLLSRHGDKRSPADRVAARILRFCESK